MKLPSLSLSVRIPPGPSICRCEPIAVSQGWSHDQSVMNTRGKILLNICIGCVTKMFRCLGLNNPHTTSEWLNVDHFYLTYSSSVFSIVESHSCHLRQQALKTKRYLSSDLNFNFIDFFMRFLHDKVYHLLYLSARIWRHLKITSDKKNCCCSGS